MLNKSRAYLSLQSPFHSLSPHGLNNLTSLTGFLPLMTCWAWFQLHLVVYKCVRYSFSIYLIDYKLNCIFYNFAIVLQEFWSKILICNYLLHSVDVKRFFSSSSHTLSNSNKLVKSRKDSEKSPWSNLWLTSLLNMFLAHYKWIVLH